MQMKKLSDEVESALGPTSGRQSSEGFLVTGEPLQCQASLFGSELRSGQAKRVWVRYRTASTSSKNTSFKKIYLFISLLHIQC